MAKGKSAKQVSFPKGYGHMVLDYYVARVREIRQERQERLAAIKTEEEACIYRDRVSQVIRQIFFPFPEKTPLQAKTTG
ncbi:MAG: hypothetical protein NC911_05620, partial [Candidatus Omnitrophica bacterium]|nr:hypothetical protein [Candidatus Omnitrophota bacterium]